MAPIGGPSALDLALPALEWVAMRASADPASHGPQVAPGRVPSLLATTRSGGSGSRPRIPRSHISLIRRISSDDPEWGEDRIALELKAKLGVEHAPSTIRRFMVTRKGDGRPVYSRRRTFLAGHAAELWALDLTTQPLWNYSVRCVLVLMELRSRRVVHVAVTASPTLAWVKQRIREATPFGSAPRFLVHDNDGIFGLFGSRRLGKTGRSYRSALDLWLGEVLCIKGIPIPYGAPNAQAHIERFMGSLKRECLNHFIFFRKTTFVAPWWPTSPITIRADLIRGSKGSSSSDRACRGRSLRQRGTARSRS